MHVQGGCEKALAMGVQVPVYILCVWGGGPEVSLEHYFTRALYSGPTLVFETVSLWGLVFDD